ncbi:uncharacterized protein LOC113500173 isoform X2 [Trichoplusia ni]|uniref:Uncharacterized protein LOC113500173 isoform X2 n=1 Tax=Trichoplusia ni TaxID=7111 RepID=A0A7E5W7S6_TRINI|nr:uncharacterized protein LOC113500173 isoform X2 [Trichoplusia ni]
MAISDDVIAMVHDLSDAGLTVTLIGAPEVNTEELESPTRSPNREASTHRMGRVEERHRRYSRMSEEVCPTKDREAIRKKLSKRMDIRYLNEIKSFKDKIKSSYLLSCSPQQCPMIQERLTQHQQDCHSGTYQQMQQPVPTCSAVLRCRDQAINVSPTLSRMRLPKFTLPLNDEGRVVQTELTMKDLSPGRTPSKHLTKKNSEILSRDVIPLRKSRTREVLPKRNFYKEHLQNEILNWLQTVPMFYTLNFTTKDIKENIVNNLAEKINLLAVEVTDDSYEAKTKIEIENCLSRLPMWLPGTKRDQATFKDGLKQKLWVKIRELNENFLGIKYEKSVGNEKEEERIPLTNDSYEREVIDWSYRLPIKEQNGMRRQQVVDLIMKKLTPLLKIPLHTTSYKLILKGEIIDILDDLPLALSSPRYKTVQLNRYAEELANRLLTIQIKHEANSSKNPTKDAAVYHQCTSQVMGMPIQRARCSYKSLIQERIAECLDKVQVCHRNDLIEEICLTFLDAKDNLRSSDELSIKNEIHEYLRDTGKLSEEQSMYVAKMIIKHVKITLNNINNSASTSFDSVIPELSGTISVYMWGRSNHATSTPKKMPVKEIPKLNAEEQSYMNNVASVVKAWMNTLPKQFNEDKMFKETIINDLAGDIMDELKVNQLAPEAIKDKENYLNYMMYRWLYRYEVFPNETIRTEAKPYIEDFIRRLKTVPEPKLTSSQHGTRQAMEHIKHMQGERGWEEDYLAKGIDVLEDQISVWMNEQPTEIYANKDKGKRNKQVHDLALTLQDRLRSKSPEEDMEQDINKWLGKVVKPKEKEHIGLLTQNLLEKIVNTPQDQTLEAKFEDRKRYIADHLEAKRQKANPSTQPTQDYSNVGNIEGDPDKTIRDFIAKFIEHNYDIDDPMAIGAFSHLLKTKLRILSPPTRKEVYDNFGKSKPHERFNPQKLQLELEYIKAISDWLMNIPIEASYNTPGNRRRIEFINDLAKNVQEIEEQRVNSPDEMNYNYLIASLILHSMHSYGLPILPEHKNNTPLMVDQLLQKLVAFRSSELSSQGNQTVSSSCQSTNLSDIREQNLSEFIVDYIRINGREIADDETKLEAWTARLMKEVKKMLHADADPSTLSKAQVYNKFNEVPIPGDESVRRYALEIAYVKEITDWMKNLPLLSIENYPEAQERQIKMISELAEKMADTEATRNSDPTDDTADKNLEDYITCWITRLPLDPNKDLVVPIVVQQLMKRKEKVRKRDQKPENESLSSYDRSKSEKSNRQTSLGNKKTNKEKSISKWCKTDKGNTNPATVIVEAIENWSNKLPIKGDEKEVKAIKEGIATKLYQKVGELNVDPRIFNDDLLYTEMLGDEIDTQLENVPQNPELQKNRQKLKEGLLNTIVDTKEAIKEKSAGDNYKHKLETTIDVSIPNPVQNTQIFDPGFEIYKSHLASMFILENFDHANDDVKAKYEKRVRDEIDKYFENAQNRNALPLTKDQIYNELYSALFKVPMPNENSVKDEVEQVKTRCEIDTWFEDLPLKEPDDLGELLEWDKILSTLAKRVHGIEKLEPKAEDKMHKEIVKWLEKLPLLPDEEGVDGHATRLQNILKSTYDARKYVAKDPQATSKGKKLKEKKTKDNKSKKVSPNVSQVPGPSGGGENWESPKETPHSKSTKAKPCCDVTPMTNKKSGDIITEVVEDWCNQLPLVASDETNVAIKDNVSTRIIIHISDLNMDPEIFNDDVVYDEILDEELESVMSNLPVPPDFEHSKAARKYQLKEMIKSIKPIIKEERARHEYKEELNNTVANILKVPEDTTAEKIKEFIKLKDEIVENFVQYNYNKNDEEGKQIYKKNVHDAVVKYFIDIKENLNEEQVDPLVRRNQLLSELGKIPIPNEALKDEVEEIRMRAEVEQFFQEQSVPDGDVENKLKKNLAKRLHNLERSGHNCNAEKKMKHDIIRCLKKLNCDVSPKTVEDFVEKLKNNESHRKTPPVTNSRASGLNQTGPYGFSIATGPQDPQSFNVGGNIVAQSRQNTIQQTYGPLSPQQATINTQNMNQSGGQWLSLQPASEPPNFDSYSQTNFSGPDGQLFNSYGPDDVDQLQGQPNLTDSNYSGARPVRSYVISKGNVLPGQDLDQSINYNDFAGGPLLNSTMSPTQGVGAQTVNQVPQSPNNMREVASSPSPIDQPNYGQIATPRQVALAPPLMQGQNMPAEPVFQGPMYKYIPMHQPFTVPIIEPGQMLGSHCSMRPLRPLSGPDNSIISKQGMIGPPIPLSMGRQGMVAMSNERRSKGNYESSDEEEVCKCDRGRYLNCRGPPYCMVAMDEFFEDCVGFGPLWCGVPFPECFYY